MDWEVQMRRALRLAEQAGSLGEIPVGAIVVKGDAVIGQGFNRRETDKDPTAHAELLAIRDAAQTLGDWRLTGCSLFVTLEPCLMCTGAILQCRPDVVVFGADDPEEGGCGGRLMLPDLFPSRAPAIYGGVLASDCFDLLQRFFKNLR